MVGLVGNGQVLHWKCRALGLVKRRDEREVVVMGGTYSLHYLAVRKSLTVIWVKPTPLVSMRGEYRNFVKVLD